MIKEISRLVGGFDFAFGVKLLVSKDSKELGVRVKVHMFMYVYIGLLMFLNIS